jgi:zinc/manganese transport system substrate-binding protein
MTRSISFGKSVLLLGALVLLAGCGGKPANPSPASPGQIAVVAAENFYGDIARQIGGNRVSVTSILSDPNIDPHEYETSVQNALAVTRAQIVIKNGDGYDSWMDKLIEASPIPERVVITAGEFAVDKLPDNPHYWYSIDNMQAVAKEIAAALGRLDGSGKTEFEANLAKFDGSLTAITEKMDGMRSSNKGVPIGLTETIFLYQANRMGLQVMTPAAFAKAVSEGNDPPADTVLTMENQLAQRQIKTLIYNQQTVSPLTANLKEEAGKMNIPVVGVTETMPSDKTYQQWMLSQLDALQIALGG